MVIGMKFDQLAYKLVCVCVSVCVFLVLQQGKDYFSY